MKGRDKYGRPTEGVNEVPVRPKEKQECLSQLVNMLQQANKREELKEAVKFWSRKYHSLYQEHMALKYDDHCTDCQKKRDVTPKGGCIELCRVLKRQANRPQSSTRFGKERRTNQILARLL